MKKKKKLREKKEQNGGKKNEDDKTLHIKARTMYVLRKYSGGCYVLYVD